MPLRVLIVSAYGVQSFQVSGPSRMDSQRFDVIAKVPGGTTKEDAQVILHNLLADRFRLKLHKDAKEAPSYELVAAKGGIKLKEAAQPTAAPAEGAGPGPKRPQPEGGGSNPAGVSRDSNDSGPTIFHGPSGATRPEARIAKGPVDRLVVDSVEKMPTEN